MISARLMIQQEKYRQRGGVFPVRFTGSFHDFTLIAIAWHAHRDQPDDEVANPLVEGEVKKTVNTAFTSQYLGTMKDGACPSMMCFSVQGVNLWLKRFHDYWLRLIDLVSKNDDRHYSACVTKYAPSFCQTERETMMELLLALFEKDVYSSPSDEKVQQTSLDYVRHYASPVNSHLAANIISGMESP